MADHLQAAPGVTSVVGSGGKTSIILDMAAKLKRQGERCIITTTTHMFDAEDVPLYCGDSASELDQLLCLHGTVMCAAPSELKEGGRPKFGAPHVEMAELAELAPYVLVEADGSKHLPLKAHEPWEPVVPDCSSQTLLVVGAHGLGLPIRAATHRPELFCARAGVDSPCAPATPEAVACALQAENLTQNVVVNVSLATPSQRSAAVKLKALLPDWNVQLVDLSSLT